MEFTPVNHARIREWNSEEWVENHESVPVHCCIPGCDGTADTTNEIERELGFILCIDPHWKEWRTNGYTPQWLVEHKCIVVGSRKTIAEWLHSPPAGQR